MCVCEGTSRAPRRRAKRRAMQNNFGRGSYPGPQQSGQGSGGPPMPQMKAAGSFKGAVGALAVAQKLAAPPQDTSESTPARGAPYRIRMRAAMPLLPATAHRPHAT